MELFSRFKRDYLHYLISIIVPAIINAISIPLFKRILGSEGYGNFSITINSLLLLTAALTGWMTQSILRFFPAAGNKKVFAKKSLRLTVVIQLVLFLPVSVIVAVIQNDWLLGILYAATLIAVSLQFTMLSLSQSAFLSVKSIFSEIIRTVSYITVALLLLSLFPQHYMYALFVAILVSYLFSFLYLYRQTFLSLQRAESPVDPAGEHITVRQFVTYGLPLSLWFIFAYLISYSDKLFLSWQRGAGNQGDYQAVFDLLSKSITALISPVVISIFPLLSTAWQTGDQDSARRLMRKIIWMEATGWAICSLLYFLFGAEWLFRLTHVTDNSVNRLTGYIIITGTFIWQIAMIVHKRYEMNMNTRFLLIAVLVAASFQLLLYLMAGSNNLLVYPAGFLLATSSYLLLVAAGSWAPGRSKWRE